MTRSVHTTRRDIEEAKRADYANRQQRAKAISDLKQQIAAKRRVKDHVRTDRSKPDELFPPADAESIPFTVKDKSEYLHYPASPDDIRAVMRLLPRGVLDGLAGIKLCLANEHQKAESANPDRERDPQTGRIGYEMLPGVFSGWCLGVYNHVSRTIGVLGYVYDPNMPDRAMWECYLRLCMLSTFVHEVAHHYDLTTRARRREAYDRNKVEIYAEHVQHDWVQAYVLPHIQKCYSKQARALSAWIEHHGGIAIPFAMISGDPRTTCKNGMLNIGVAWFDMPSAVANLARSVADGESLVENRLCFALNLHYGERYELAHHIIDGVLALEQNNLEALTLRADIFVHEERYSEAQEVAECVVKRDETKLDAWEDLAHAYEALGEWQALVGVTTRLVGNPKAGRMCRTRWLLARARAHVALGNPAEAAADIAAVEAIEWPSPHGGPTWLKKKIADVRERMRDG